MALDWECFIKLSLVCHHRHLIKFSDFPVKLFEERRLILRYEKELKNHKIRFMNNLTISYTETPLCLL